MDKVTDYKDATTYNNFYEFGTDKADPGQERRHAEDRPWTGARSRAWSSKPGKFGIEDLIKLSAAGRAHLPPALRRGLVDGDSVGRLLAVRTDQEGRAAPAMPSSSSS